MTALAEFRAAPLAGAEVVWIAGELDLSNVAELESAVRAAQAASPAKVVVDLSGVLYLDSSAVRTLITHAREPVPVRLVAPPGSFVRRTLSTLGMEAYLPVHDTVADAARPVP